MERTEPTPTARMDPITTGPTGTEPTATARTGPTATPRIPTGTTPPDRRFPNLARLVGPEAVGPFLAGPFGRDAFRTRLEPDTARRLFGWPELKEALAAHRLAPPRLRLEQGGADVTKGLFRSRRSRRGLLLQDIDAAVLNARLRDGATLILDAANELNPPLRALCAGLAAEFGCACQANLYACWGTSQGFDVHWDDHDVFVVQVEGRKRWALYGSTRAFPTRRDHHGEHPRPEAPTRETVLEPGDVLYLPRGYWHAAVGLGGPTLHLTIGLTRKSGSDFLHWLADHALSEPAARADLPLERDDAVLGAHLAGLISALAAEDPEALGRLYRRHVEAGQAQRPELSFPFLGETGEKPGPGARVRLSPGAARLRDGGEGEVVLSWRGTEFTVSAEMAGPLHELVDGRALAYAEVEAAASQAARPLVAGFVAEMAARGVLLIEPEPAS